MSTRFSYWASVSMLIYLSFYLLKPPFYLSNEIAVDYYVLGIMALAFAAYIFGQKSVNSKKVKSKHVLLFALILHFLVVFMPTFSSNDLLTYTYWSRVDVRYESNPYYTSYSNFTKDAFYDQLSNIWSDNTYFYGPLPLVFGRLLSVGNKNLYFSIYSFKLGYTLLNILAVILLYKFTKSKMAVYLYAFNPLVIFHLGFDNHTESLIVITLLAVFFLLKKKGIVSKVLSIVAITLSVLVKFYTVLLLPLLLFFHWAKKKSTKSYFYFVLLAGLVSAVAAIFLYLPFWEGVDIFNRLGELSTIRTTSPSPGIWAFQLIGKWIGVRDSFEFGESFSKMLFWVFYTWILARSATNTSYKVLLGASTLILVLLFVMYFNILLPWYTIPVIALASVYSTINGRLAVVVVCVVTVLSFLIYLYV